jgi:hypothetical protein
MQYHLSQRHSELALRPQNHCSDAAVTRVSALNYNLPAIVEQGARQNMGSAETSMCYAEGKLRLRGRNVK